MMNLSKNIILGLLYQNLHIYKCYFPYDNESTMFILSDSEENAKNSFADIYNGYYDVMEYVSNNGYYDCAVRGHEEEYIMTNGDGYVRLYADDTTKMTFLDENFNVIDEHTGIQPDDVVIESTEIDYDHTHRFFKWMIKNPMEDVEKCPYTGEWHDSTESIEIGQIDNTEINDYYNLDW